MDFNETCVFAATSSENPNVFVVGMIQTEQGGRAIRDTSEESDGIVERNTCKWYFDLINFILNASFDSVFATVFMGLLGLMFVSMVVMGVVYWDECTIVPFFTVALGIIGIITMISLLKRCKKKEDGPSTRETMSLFWLHNYYISNHKVICILDVVILLISITCLASTSAFGGDVYFHRRADLTDVLFDSYNDSYYCDYNFHYFALRTFQILMSLYLLPIGLDILTVQVMICICCCTE